MEWVSVISGILGSATGGGVIGGLFGLLNKREGRKVLELEMQDKELERAHSLKELELEATTQIQVAESEGAIQLALADQVSLQTSLKQQVLQTGIVAVDAVRSLMRPVITTYLLFAVSILAWKLHQLVGGLEALPVEELVNLYKYVVMQTVAMAAIAIGWWFASRPPRIQKG